MAVQGTWVSVIPPAGRTLRGVKGGVRRSLGQPHFTLSLVRNGMSPGLHPKGDPPPFSLE